MVVGLGVPSRRIGKTKNEPAVVDLLEASVLGIGLFGMEWVMESVIDVIDHSFRVASHQTTQTSWTAELIGTALLQGKGNASALLKSDTVIDDLAVPRSPCFGESKYVLECFSDLFHVQHRVALHGFALF